MIDHEFDILVNSDCGWHWKGEESFTSKIGVPAYWTRDEAERVREEATMAVGQIESGTGIFDGGWRGFAPDPAWATPIPPSAPARLLPN